MSTIAELRDQLRQRQEAAKEAGLVRALTQVDFKLMVTVRECMKILDEALAAKAASDLSTAHDAIVESLDDATAAPPRAPLAPMKKPPLPLGAAPAMPARMPAPRKLPPKLPRKPTGPDAMDELIPW